MNIPSDEKLVARYLKGDHEAFGTLYNRYHNLVSRICRKRIRHEEDVEDVAQDTFLRALQKIRLFRGDHERPNFKGWIAKIALRHTDDYLKSHSPKRQKSKAIAECYSCEISNVNPHDLALQRELKDAMLQAIDSMPHIQRNVFVDYYMHGFSTSDICRTYGLTENQAAYQRRKACLSVEKVLSKEYPDLRFWKRRHGK